MIVAADTAMGAALLAPMIGLVAIYALGRRENAREAATLLMGAALLGLTIVVFTAVGDGERPRLDLIEVSPGLSIALAAEPLGAVFALLASALFIVNSLYSIGYMRGHHEKHQTRFYMCFAVSIAAAMGVAYAANLYTMFVFYEALTLATFPLVTHKGDADAKRGGRVYLGVLMATSIGLLLPAIVWTHAIAGGAEFTPGGILAGKLSEAGPLPAALWMERHEPAAAGATRWYLSTWEWLAFRLTGKAVAPLVAHEDAPDLGRAQAATGLHIERRPPAGSMGAIVGTLTGAAADALGLRAGIRAGTELCGLGTKQAGFTAFIDRIDFVVQYSVASLTSTVSRMTSICFSPEDSL